MAESKATNVAAMNLYQKLAAITGEVGVIKKDGRNTEQKFDFIEYAAVAGKLRELFAKYGVVIVPRMQKAHQQHRTEVTSKWGAKGMAVLIDMSFNVINADKPDEKFTVTWTGEAIDYGDKATNKAATSALKYYLMRQFNISEKGDDADADSPDRGQATEPKTAPKPAPQPLQASQEQITMIRETAKVKGKTQEWTDAILKKFTVGKASKAAQSVIDGLNVLEDSQEPPTESDPLEASRAETKKAVEALEAEINAEHDDKPLSQWDAHSVLRDMSSSDEPPVEDKSDSRRLDPKKTQRIYKLGGQLGLSREALIKRVDQLENNADADEAIAILQEDLAKKQSGKSTSEEGRG